MSNMRTSEEMRGCTDNKTMVKSETPFIIWVRKQRADVKNISLIIWEEIGRQSQACGTPETSELLQNLILAYRHSEDTAMRLGKVIQAADGGVSVYDK